MKQDMNSFISKSSISLLSLVRSLGFGLLGLITIVALGQGVFSIITKGAVGLDNLLLLFIYLHVLAMVRAQLMKGEIPLSIPFTIAMLLLSRYLLMDMRSIANWQALAIGGGMFLLALSLLALRYWKNAKHEISEN